MTARGNSLASRDIASLVHPLTNLKTHPDIGPTIMSRGDGVYVWDDSGRRYLEGISGLWCTSLGFSEPRLMDAADRQMRTLPTYHIFAHKSHEPGIVLAERLLAIAPVPMSKVFFANSGSEATDTAIKLVWYYNNALGRPNKKKIISRVRAYHGVTVAAGCLTGLPVYHRDFDLPLTGILHADCPHHYGFSTPGETEKAFALRLAANLEAMIMREGPETIAAMIAEPVMGAGGVLIPPSTYFARIQPILRKHGILLIADEVICGFGRTGNMFGTQTYDLQPDLITLSKSLSSGYLPISAVMVSEAVWQAMVSQSAKIGVFGIGFTQSASPVPAAVAIETLNIYEDRDIVSHVRRVAPRLQAGLLRLGAHPLIGEACGVGLLGAIQFVQSKQPKTYFEPTHSVAAFYQQRCEAHGLILRSLFGDRVAICPPLIITESQIDELLDVMSRALDETAVMVQEKRLAAVA